MADTKQLNRDLGLELARIAKRFNQDVKMTLIVRVPSLRDGDILITDDEPELAIRAIRRLQEKEPRMKNIEFTFTLGLIILVLGSTMALKYASFKECHTVHAAWYCIVNGK